MTQQEFIHVLEAVLQCADSNISMLDFKKKDGNIVDIFYEDSIVYSVSVRGMNLLEILSSVATKCLEIRSTDDLEKMFPDYEDGIKSSQYDDWKTSKAGTADLEKLNYYLYRMLPIQKDYIFGKMAAMLLNDRSPDNPFLDS